jgi:bifunctional non-homologous end joining protein LigD
MTLNPIIPFEPQSSTTIPTGAQWISQVKWDGVRILTYYDGQELRLFNRKQRERTQHYPELTDIGSFCKTESVILDGEMIALGPGGTPSFHEVMRRDGLRRMERVNQARQEVPVTYVIFDMVYCDGEWIHTQPLSYRMERLQSLITPNEHVQLVSSHPDGQALFHVVEQRKMEGIVCKDIRSAYAMDGKDDRWLKVKNYGDVIAVVGGFTINGGIVNAILTGLFDQQGNLWYIGHTGTGRLTKADWRDLTERLKPMVVDRRPFANKPERHGDAYWVKPELTVKIKYSEWRWQEGRSMRQPSIQSFVDVPPEECLFPQE